MKRATPFRIGAMQAQRGLLARALAVLMLLAFAFQGYLTQTHIHGAAPGAPAAVDVFDGVSNHGHDKQHPGKDDPANCPLCQQFASSGHFITPAAAAVLLPSLSVSVIEVVSFAVHFVAPVTHDWRGRAPPHP